MAEEQKFSLHVEPARISTLYANAFQTRCAEGEILLTCGVSHVEPSPDDPSTGTVVVEMQNRIAMTPQSARRLASTLLQALREYEERHGAAAAPSAGGEH